ncbi:MAG: dTDP-4-dehydrorhamnose reductase [Alphaproteobacteria bacterium]|nr:dTDP-4-dehydrorhamnose reductase [Alphaproteobacteria bacterium]
MSSILVLGREGQLARSLAERAAAHGLALAFTGRPEADLADPDSLRRVVRGSGAEIIVNAAAHTAVDQAEDEPEAARALNAEGPRALAEAARETGARLVHVSTDYVFDGSGDRPWREDDPTGPRSVYGRTKLEGEEAIRAVLPAHAILRTAWVYSPFGRNFVKTMLAVAETRHTLTVVGDQVGNPTSALDIADGILTMIGQWHQEPGRGLGKTYHLAGTGSTSWADFARAIFQSSRARGGPWAEVTDIATADWPAKAPRPLNSRLDSGLFAETFGYRAPPWRDSLETVVDRLLGATAGRD